MSLKSDQLEILFSVYHSVSCHGFGKQIHFHFFLKKLDVVNNKLIDIRKLDDDNNYLNFILGACCLLVVVFSANL